MPREGSCLLSPGDLQGTGKDVIGPGDHALPATTDHPAWMPSSTSGWPWNRRPSATPSRHRSWPWNR